MLFIHTGSEVYLIASSFTACSFSHLLVVFPSSCIKMLCLVKLASDSSSQNRNPDPTGMTSHVVCIRILVLKCALNSSLHQQVFLILSFDRMRSWYLLLIIKPKWKYNGCFCNVDFHFLDLSVLLCAAYFHGDYFKRYQIRHLHIQFVLQPT